MYFLQCTNVHYSLVSYNMYKLMKMNVLCFTALCSTCRLKHKDDIAAKLNALSTDEDTEEDSVKQHASESCDNADDSIDMELNMAELKDKLISVLKVGSCHIYQERASLWGICLML